MDIVDKVGQFSFWDWGVAGLLISSTIVSIWRGFSREAVSLLGWVVSFVLANIYATTLATNLEGFIDNVIYK
mgnify:CR=1 FL=1